MPLATGGLISSLLATPVTGQPYSAIQTYSTLKTLADGSTVSHRGHHSIARDAEGRVHVEMRMARGGGNGQPDEVLVFVMDPVAHLLTVWLASAPAPMQTNIASTFKIPTQPGANTQPRRAVDPTRPQPVVTVSDLGTETMQGLEVTGRQTTTILPVGESGNSAPITSVHQVWTSADLQLVLKQRWNDPRSGERTVELEKLSRANPDPALFHAPDGYRVKSAVESLKDLEEELGAEAQ